MKIFQENIRRGRFSQLYRDGLRVQKEESKRNRQQTERRHIQERIFEMAEVLEMIRREVLLFSDGAVKNFVST
jgi:hypothetical protein